MNRIVSVLFALLLVLSFVACSDDDVSGVAAGSYTITITPSTIPTNYGEGQNGAIKFTEAELQGDTLEFFILAEPATGISPLDAQDHSWGTKVAKMTKVGTGASQTWTFTFSATDADLNAWGVGDAVNCKILAAKSADDYWNGLSAGFVAYPCGNGNLQFANITTLGVTGTVTAESTGSGEFFASGAAMTWGTCSASTNVFAVPFAYLSSSPSDGGTTLASTTNISFTFNKAIDASMISGGKLVSSVALVLTNTTDGGAAVLDNAASLVDAWLSSDSKTLNIPVTLVNLKDYSVTLSGLTGGGGLALANAPTNTFSVVEFRDVSIQVDISGTSAGTAWVGANAYIYSTTTEDASHPALTWNNWGLNQVGTTSVYSNSLRLAGGFSVIFINGAGHSGDSDQTVDITCDATFDSGTYTISGTSGSKWTGAW